MRKPRGKVLLVALIVALILILITNSLLVIIYRRYQMKTLQKRSLSTTFHSENGAHYIERYMNRALESYEGTLAYQALNKGMCYIVDEKGHLKSHIVYNKNNDKGYLMTSQKSLKGLKKGYGYLWMTKQFFKLYSGEPWLDIFQQKILYGAFEEENIKQVFKVYVKGMSGYPHEKDEIGEIPIEAFTKMGDYFEIKKLIEEMESDLEAGNLEGSEEKVIALEKALKKPLFIIEIQTRLYHQGEVIDEEQTLAYVTLESDDLAVLKFGEVYQWIKEVENSLDSIDETVLNQIILESKEWDTMYPIKCIETFKVDLSAYLQVPTLIIHPSDQPLKVYSSQAGKTHFKGVLISYGDVLIDGDIVIEGQTKIGGNWIRLNETSKLQTIENKDMLLKIGNDQCQRDVLRLFRLAQYEVMDTPILHESLTLKNIEKVYQNEEDLRWKVEVIYSGK